MMMMESQTNSSDDVVNVMVMTYWCRPKIRSANNLSYRMPKRRPLLRTFTFKLISQSYN